MSVIERVKQKECSYGLNISLMDPTILEIAAQAGIHFVRLDCEHILFNPETIARMLQVGRLLGLDVQVRVPSLNNVTALLDMGASAIMVPHIESKEDALKAVQVIKYPPLGDRGLTGAARVLGFGRLNVKEYQRTANENVLFIAQIESKKGMENIDEILSVEGLDMVATGRNDLSQSLGMPGDKNHPKVLEAEEFIIRKTVSYGKIPTILCKNPTRRKQLYELGVRCFSIARDDSLLKTALQGQLEKLTME